MTSGLEKSKESCISRIGSKSEMKSIKNSNNSRTWWKKKSKIKIRINRMN